MLRPNVVVQPIGGHNVTGAGNQGILLVIVHHRPGVRCVQILAILKITGRIPAPVMPRKVFFFILS